MANETTTLNGRASIAIGFAARWNYICVGTGGHATNDPFTPVPPTEADTDLETPVLVAGSRYQTPVIAEYPNSPDQKSVRAKGIILKNTLSGAQITEAGLYDVDGKLVARKTFPVKTMDADTDYEQFFTFNF